MTVAVIVVVSGAPVFVLVQIFPLLMFFDAICGGLLSKYLHSWLGSVHFAFRTASWKSAVAHTCPSYPGDVTVLVTSIVAAGVCCLLAGLADPLSTNIWNVHTPELQLVAPSSVPVAFTVNDLYHFPQTGELGSVLTILADTSGCFASNFISCPPVVVELFPAQSSAVTVSPDDTHVELVVTLQSNPIGTVSGDTVAVHVVPLHDMLPPYAHDDQISFSTTQLN